MNLTLDRHVRISPQSNQKLMGCAYDAYQDSGCSYHLCALFFLNTHRTVQEQPTRVEIGPLFTYLALPDSIPINAQNQAEIGGRFSWNFSRHVALEAETEGSPFRTTNLTTPTRELPLAVLRWNQGR